MTERYEESKNKQSPSAAADTPLITFTDPSGISVVSGTEGTPGYLLLDPSVEYPSTGEGVALDGLLLPETDADDKRRLELPVNYVTMAQALNDTIGDNTSDEAIELMQGLFIELGVSLGGLIRTDRLVPEGLSYKHVIFSREVKDPRLLPPIKFVPLGEKEVEPAEQEVAKSLGASCLVGAANTTQYNNLSAVLSGFEQSLMGK